MTRQDFTSRHFVPRWHTLLCSLAECTALTLLTVLLLERTALPHTHTHTRTHARTHTLTHTHIHTHACTHAHPHTRTHTHTHAHTHTHNLSFSLRPSSVSLCLSGLHPSLSLSPAFIRLSLALSLSLSGLHP